MSIHETDTNNEDYSATYCPEDNKLRLYTGRVHRETFLYLRRAGFKATPKQDCDFVAPWSVWAEEICFSMIPENDDIGDEDTSPEERAADRAERFAGYRDNRRSDAAALADRHDITPIAYGFQSQAKADRAAARRDRIRDRSLCQWDKAEYWQRRTAGVISNALHRSSAPVRRGRILEIEREIRRIENNYTPAENVAPMQPGDKWNDKNETQFYIRNGSRGGRWVTQEEIDSNREHYSRLIEHLRNRLIYENAMLENEGGKAADVEMIPGGFITCRGRRMRNGGEFQIVKVNKSNTTGRVVSVEIHCHRNVHRMGKLVSEFGPVKINIERSGENIYRAPTAEELETFNQQQKQQKAEAKKTKPKTPPLINPTQEDAVRLQALINQKRSDNDTVLQMSQAKYSANSKQGEYSACQTVGITEKLEIYRPSYYGGSNQPGQRVIFKIRYCRGSVVILSDKPQKPLPFEECAAVVDSWPSFDACCDRLDELYEMRGNSYRTVDGLTDDQKQLFSEMRYHGLAFNSTVYDWGISELGYKIWLSQRLLAIAENAKSGVGRGQHYEAIRNGFLTTDFELTESGRAAVSQYRQRPLEERKAAAAE